MATTTQVMPHQQVKPRPPMRSVSRRLETYRPSRNCFEMLKREAEFERVLMPRKVELIGGIVTAKSDLL
ncbi:MAG: hypothetical protein AAF921_10070 [Cyanobacteria bacterium P01_D01_bin.44]